MGSAEEVAPCVLFGEAERGAMERYRVTAVLKRSLEATTSQLERNLQDAKRLLKRTGRE